MKSSQVMEQMLKKSSFEVRREEMERGHSFGVTKVEMMLVNSLENLQKHSQMTFLILVLEGLW